MPRLPPARRAALLEEAAATEARVLATAAAVAAAVQGANLPPPAVRTGVGLVEIAPHRGLFCPVPMGEKMKSNFGKTASFQIC